MGSFPHGGRPNKKKSAASLLSIKAAQPVSLALLLPQQDAPQKFISGGNAELLRRAVSRSTKRSSYSNSVQ